MHRLRLHTYSIDALRAELELGESPRRTARLVLARGASAGVAAVAPGGATTLPRGFMPGPPPAVTPPRPPRDHVRLVTPPRPSAIMMAGLALVLDEGAAGLEDAVQSIDGPPPPSTARSLTLPLSLSPPTSTQNQSPHPHPSRLEGRARAGAVTVTDHAAGDGAWAAGEGCAAPGGAC
jgi:hypothetical protein